MCNFEERLVGNESCLPYDSLWRIDSVSCFAFTSVVVFYMVKGHRSGMHSAGREAR